MATTREGRNGGKIKVMEKGDPANVGAGRPKGSRSFKTIMEEFLEKKVKGKDGSEMTYKEAAALRMISLMIKPDSDDNTAIRAFEKVRDTIGEAPETKNINESIHKIGSVDVEMITPEMLQKIKTIVGD